LDYRNGLPGAVMDRVLADRLGIAVGDSFRLGTQDFLLSSVLVREPDNTSGGFTLGPRTIVRSQDLAASGLLQPGTLFETAYRLKLPAAADLDATRQSALSSIMGGGFRWRDSRNGAPGTARFVERLSTFLILVGIAGLAVGGVGVSAAVRAHLDEKVQVIATLKSLGAENQMILKIYLIQIGLLTLAGILIGLILGAVAPLLLAPMIEARLPVPAVLGIHPGALAEAALYGALAALLFTLWPISRTEDIRAAALFRDAALGLTGWPRMRYVALTGLILVILVSTAGMFSGQMQLTGWAAAAILGAFLTLVATALAVRFLARYLSTAVRLRGRPSLRLALAAIGGRGSDAVPVVLSLGLGLSVLAAVGQIDANLRGAIARDLPKVAPSYFVVDIQSDQMDGFLQRLHSDPGVKRVEAAPMLRGIITRINGRPARDVAGDHWVLQGDRGITYSDRPPEGTKVTTGTWWPENYSGAPQMSFAEEEALEMGLELGDRITVNVLGREITATLTSFREVDFSNAGMGFVVSMNPSSLAGAPHSWISTIYADDASEAEILRGLTSDFPNITAIRVRDAIDRVSEVLRGIAAAITYGAAATLLTGVIVLIGAAAAGERTRTYEAAILKTLGATRADVLKNFLWRSAVLGFAAGSVAILAGGFGGWAVTHFVMETDFRFEPVSAILIILGGVTLSVLAGVYFSLRSLNARPGRILASRE
jgi:putative ABC transport system permease protein